MSRVLGATVCLFSSFRRPWGRHSQRICYNINRWILQLCFEPSSVSWNNENQSE